MTGTPKQIAWAEDIKRRVLGSDARNAEYLADVARILLNERVPEPLKQSANELYADICSGIADYWDWLESQDSATWWIGHYNSSLHDLRQLYFRDHAPQAIRMRIVQFKAMGL